MTTTLKVTGMSCGHCVGAVRRALESVPGVKVETVEIGAATVTYDPAATAREALVDAIEEAGYEVKDG